MRIDQIAAVCHDANRRYCKALGDDSQPVWHLAHKWQKDSCIAGVKLLLRDPSTTPEQLHETWMAHKVAEGWEWGPFKNMIDKRHPCMAPFDELPPERQAKDRLFKAIVGALAPLIDAAEPHEREPADDPAGLVGLAALARAAAKAEAARVASGGLYSIRLESYETGVLVVVWGVLNGRRLHLQKLVPWESIEVSNAAVLDDMIDRTISRWTEMAEKRGGGDHEKTA